MNVFTLGTDGGYYTNFNNANDAKGFQILSHYCSIILSLGIANHKYWLISLVLFKIGKLSAMYCQI